MHKRPKVSIILTSYNHAKYIRAAIDSVLSQTFADFELIIFDDASTDDSAVILHSYSDLRIQVHINTVNKATMNINTAIAEIAAGEYIAIHHSDDVWEADKLEKQVAFLDQNPNIGAVFSQVHLIGEHGEYLDEKNTNIFNQSNRTRHEWLRTFFWEGNKLCHPSVLIRKKCYQECGLYRNGIHQLDDLDMWIRLCIKYDIHVLPERLVQFRLRANAMNTSANTKVTRIRSKFENFILMHNYKMIKTPEDFLKIFPMANKYFQQESFDVEFALGMVCLEENTKNETKLFGLLLLFAALNDPAREQKISQCYGFYYNDFIHLTAKHDAFSIEVIAALTTTMQNLNLRIAEKDLALQKIAQKENPLAEKRTIAREDFNVVYYLKCYPDVALSGMDPYEHFIQFGEAEGRICVSNTVNTDSEENPHKHFFHKQAEASKSS